jgi:hypothetical protein
LAACGGARETEVEIQDHAGLLQSVHLANAPPHLAPPGYVVTPHGFFHPSCVVELAADERFREDRTIARSDGSTRTIAPCAYSHYDKHGREIAPDASGGPPPPATDQWVIYGDDQTNGPLRFISANWSVPDAPWIDGNQVVYYFPGLVNLPANGTVLQPVLGWFHGWTIASWDCCEEGFNVHSAMKPVRSGDPLFGFAEGSNCDTNSGEPGSAHGQRSARVSLVSRAIRAPPSRTASSRSWRLRAMAGSGAARRSRPTARMERGPTSDAEPAANHVTTKLH